MVCSIRYIRYTVTFGARSYPNRVVNQAYVFIVRAAGDALEDDSYAIQKFSADYLIVVMIICTPSKLALYST